MTGPAVVAGGELYADERNGFSLRVPDGWEVRKGVAGLLVSLVAPEAEEGGFRPNLNVVRKVRDRAPDLDALAHDALKTLQRLLTDLIVIDVDAGVVADLPARRVLVAYRQGVFALTSEQWIVAGDDHIWTISAGAAADRWNEEADAFARIVRSLELNA